MLDDATRDRFDTVRDRSRSYGLDLATTLDSHGLLLTPARRQQVRRDVLEELAAKFNALPAHDVLRRHLGRVAAATPLDMHRAIAGALETWVHELGEADGR